MGRCELRAMLRGWECTQVNTGVEPLRSLALSVSNMPSFTGETKASANSGIDNFVYVDFIHNDKSKGLVTQDIAKLLNATIDFVQCRTDCSGPKEEEAIEYFSRGTVDFGRM